MPAGKHLTKALPLRLPEPLNRRLREQAAAEGRSLSDLLRASAETYLETHMSTRTTIKTPLPASDGSASTVSHWEPWSQEAREAFRATQPPTEDQAAREDALEAFLTREYPAAQVFATSWVPTPAHGHIKLPQWADDYLQHGSL